MKLQKKGLVLSDEVQKILKKATLKELKRDFSPDFNPLVEPTTVEMKKRLVRSGTSRSLVDPETGELSAVSSIHTVEWKDDEEFVKVFAAGVAESYKLSKTGQRVFQAILREYQDTKMSGGFADAVYLPWFNEGLNGKAIGMSERTFNRGLRELIEARFLAPKSPEAFWVNPALFFKGNRVAFIQEYRRRAETRIESSVSGMRQIEDPHGSDRDPNTSDMFPDS